MARQGLHWHWVMEDFGAKNRKVLPRTKGKPMLCGGPETQDLHPKDGEANPPNQSEDADRPLALQHGAGEDLLPYQALFDLEEQPYTSLWPWPLALKRTLWNASTFLG